MGIVSGDFSNMRSMFSSMDTDQSGGLTAKELQEQLRRFGKEVQLGTLQNLIRLSDSDGDGLLSFEEFEEHIKGAAAMMGVKSSAPEAAPVGKVMSTGPTKKKSDPIRTAATYLRQFTDFSLNTLSGETVSMMKYAGKPTL